MQRRGVSDGGVRLMSAPLSRRYLIGPGKLDEIATTCASKNADAVDTFRRCGRTRACEEDAQDGVDQANVVQGLGIASFAVGAAALTGMIVYLVMPGTSVDGSAIHIAPFAGPTAQGLSMGGRF